MNLAARDFDCVVSWRKRLSVSDSVTKKPDTLVLFLGRLKFLLTCKVGWNHIHLKGC